MQCGGGLVWCGGGLVWCGGGLVWCGVYYASACVVHMCTLISFFLSLHSLFPYVLTCRIHLYHVSLNL